MDMRKKGLKEISTRIGEKITAEIDMKIDTKIGAKNNGRLYSGSRKRKRCRLTAAGLCTCLVLGMPLQGNAGILEQASLEELPLLRELSPLGGSALKPVLGEPLGPVYLFFDGTNIVWRSATPSNAAEQTASASNSILQKTVLSGDLWEGWVGDLSFLDGKSGKGTAEQPYQISTKAELMGLSELAACGMVIKEGTYPGDYSGAFFELTRNIDLGGINWLPIGFYKTSADLEAKRPSAFCGTFDGNGKTISNFRISNGDWTQAGLFGVVKDSEITDVTVKPGNVIMAKEEVGILVGSAENSRIRNVTVAGAVKSAGTAGGVAGTLSESSIVENCEADHVTLDSGTGKETYVGGIAGKASSSLIVDCTVNTGETQSARIQGGGYVGGIAGFQNDTDIFNVHVMGTIGGTGSQSAGGVTGKYASGKMKVARFEGKVAGTGLGSAAREGTFIGTHDTGFHFRYGTESGADLAFLFADKEEKIAAGICGCGIPEDNTFAYEDHIGFWHSSDNFYTLIEKRSTKPVEEQYFYEELEEGMLHIIDTEESVMNEECSPDHFAPNSVGRPVRGYLVSVLQIDTAANVENYYDVAVLTARGESAYSHTLNKSKRGAIAEGDVVTVTTAPKNTAEEKYQMSGVPTYTDAAGKRKPTEYQTGGTYQFVMPGHDTEISAVYKKVAAEVKTVPEEFGFHVVQERSGDRKNPSLTTEVRDGAGKLIARYINGSLEEGTQVQEVKIEAVVDKNNDVADERVVWSVDDPELIRLWANGDEDSEGYTKKSASVQLNLEADFFKDIIEKAEKTQAASQYQYPIPDTVYGDGVQGGVAVLTAKTRPAASFEGKSLTANCRIPVTFQIKDRTKVAAEGSILDKTSLEFTVTRRLSGNRKNPQETWSVTAPQTIQAKFSPDFFDKKDITWSVDDSNVIQVLAGSYGSGETDADYKNASVQAVKDTKWIRDILSSDDAEYKENPYIVRNGKGTRTAQVRVLADDMLGNRQTASCEVTVNFVTTDRTEVLPEEIRLDKENLEFQMVLTKTGPVRKPVLTWQGIEGQKVEVSVLPKETKEKAEWEFDSALVSVTSDGTVIPLTEVSWITEAMKKYPYKAEIPTELTVRTKNLEKKVHVTLKFQMVNQTYSSGASGSSGGSSSQYSYNSSRDSGTGMPVGSVTGTWGKREDGRWQFMTGGRTCAGEWAYIYNPYAGEEQEKTSWFRFDSDGAMHTGWYQEPEGGWYYLHNQSDGSQGHMYTGWHEIGGRWYYFGSDGRMDVGWNWINGKCYYLDNPDGHMFSDTETPDGYTVDKNGAWTVEGTVQTLGNFK